MKQSKQKPRGPSESARPRPRQGVFLSIHELDLKWLKAEARRREKARLGLEEEPDDAEVQPIIYDLIRRARIAASAPA